MRGHVDDDVQLVLELLEGLVGNALGPVTGVTGVFLSVTLDVGGHVVGQAHDLLLADHDGRLGIGIVDGVVGLGVCLFDDLVALAQNATRLLELLGQRALDVIEDGICRVCLDDLLGTAAGQGGLGVVDQIFQLFNEGFNFSTGHGMSSDGDVLLTHGRLTHGRGLPIFKLLRIAEDRPRFKGRL